MTNNIADFVTRTLTYFEILNVRRIKRRNHIGSLSRIYTKSTVAVCYNPFKNLNYRLSKTIYSTSLSLSFFIIV